LSSPSRQIKKEPSKLDRTKKQEETNLERYSYRATEQKGIEKHHQMRQKIIEDAKEKEKQLFGEKVDTFDSIGSEEKDVLDFGDSAKPKTLTTVSEDSVGKNIGHVG